MPLPQASLVNYAGREPGLMLVSASGEVRFWSSIHLALSGPERFQQLHLDLAAGEVVRKMVAVTVRRWPSSPC